MDITADDVKNLVFELYLAQREVQILRAENAELKHLLEQCKDQGKEGVSNDNVHTGK